MDLARGDGDAATVAAERPIVSVLFADLVGFTTLSEQLDPEDVAAIQDAYFAEVRATIERHGGAREVHRRRGHGRVRAAAHPG